jgi:hypothetical protein
MPDKRPARVASRPLPSQWAPDELLTLPEAAALFWPEGPITVRTLRSAERDGALAVTWIAGKPFTTPEAIRGMTKCTPRRPAENQSAMAADPPTELDARPAPRAMRPRLSESAQSLLQTIDEERARHKAKSRRQR